MGGLNSKYTNFISKGYTSFRPCLVFAISEAPETIHGEKREGNGNEKNGKLSQEHDSIKTIGHNKLAFLVIPNRTIVHVYIKITRCSGAVFDFIIDLYQLVIRKSVRLYCIIE